MSKGVRAAAVENALRRAAWGLAWAALFASAHADAQQYFYKWTDKDGKVQYSGQPPKDFRGEVVRIEVDPPDTAKPAPAPVPRATPDGARKAAPPPPDVATKRRELRIKLEGELARARERLELAKATLADGSTPQDDERQVIQQRFAKGQPAPGSGAMHGAAPRSNCRTVTATDGSASIICGTTIPNEAYHERQRKLEEAVRLAEEEVAAAEQAYRRGVD